MFLKHNLIGELEKYIATLGVEVYHFVFHTNRGHIQFNVWDIASQKKFGGLREWVSHPDPVGHYNCVKNIPIMLCGNKVDIKNRKAKAKSIDCFPLKEHLADAPLLSYPGIPSNYNFEKPFLWSTRKLTGNSNLGVCCHACSCPTASCHGPSFSNIVIIMI
ncbi:unnamed protein product [Nyctereutes procyonoides]|uniref:(raccoon dog) hypothetical protein n=1 Tax=Nyctereutes procyonoides TaxID=34880 RepID=A0A811YDW4_NYCPR|nr:unnamed protein product [Nyctereutes procyonoides]